MSVFTALLSSTSSSSTVYTTANMFFSSIADDFDVNSIFSVQLGPPHFIVVYVSFADDVDFLLG